MGLEVECGQILEGGFISELVGYPNASLHIVYLGLVPLPERYNVGATHLGVIVDDLDSLYEELSGKGVQFVNPPAVRPDAVYPLARKGCYMQDQGGNWLELLERPPPDVSEA